MCDKMDDHDLEDFVKKNKERIEKILSKPDEDHHEGEMKIDLGPLNVVGDAMKGMLMAFMDPKVQAHFIKAGREFFNGIGEAIKSAPLPDDVKGAVDKACEMKDRIINDIVNGPEDKPKDGKKDAEAKPKDNKKTNAGKSSGKAMKKIVVE